MFLSAPDTSWSQDLAWLSAQCKQYQMPSGCRTRSPGSELVDLRVLRGVPPCTSSVFPPDLGVLAPKIGKTTWEDPVHCLPGVSCCLVWCLFSCSVTQSCLTLSPHGLKHARLPCPSPSPGVCSNMSIELVMPSNHLILCHPLLLLPLVFPSIKVFSSELAFIRWAKY